MKTAERRSRVKWAAWVVVAGYVLFAHGCHGDDHDTELFARFWEWCGRH